MPYKTKQQMKSELDKIVNNAVNNSRVNNSLPSNEEINAQLDDEINRATLSSNLPSNKEINSQLDNEINAAVQQNQAVDGNINPDEEQEYADDPNNELFPEDQFAMPEENPEEIIRTNSADINDDIRNEHLYDLCIKLKSSSDKFSNLFTEFPEDQLTFNQMVEIRRVQKEHIEYSSQLGKYVSDYFMDKTYNENLINYLHLRNTLVELIKKVKEIAKI